MTVYAITLDDTRLETNYEIQADLNGAYLLHFYWSEKLLHWFFDLLAADGTELITGALVVKFQNLLRSVPYGSKPIGKLYFLGSNGDVECPAKDDLGNTTWLIYDDT